MPNRDAHYREAAVRCLEIAKLTAEPHTRERLVVLAANFLELADKRAAQDSVLRRLIDEFNDSKKRK